MDSLIEEAVKRDVRRRAKAARSGEPLSAADEISEVSALRQRQKDLPLLIWAAKVDHAGREIEMYAREQERAGRDAELESNGLAALKVEADEANRKLREKSNRVFRLTNAESSNSLSRARAEKG